MTPILELGFLLVVIGASVLPDASAHRARVAAGLAALTAGLALAGFAAAGYPVWGLDVARSLLAGSPPDPPVGFLAVAGALAGLGGLLAGAGGVLAWRQGSPPARCSAAALGLGAGSLTRAAVMALSPVPLSAGVGAGAAIVALGGGFVAIGRFMRIAGPSPTQAPSGSLLLGLLVATLAAAAGEHVAIILPAAIAGSWSAWLFQRRRGVSRVPVAPAVAMLLIPAWWLLATIAGSEGLAVAALPALPLSAAAERLLTPLLLLAGWATAGLWPLHRQVPGALVAPLGALVVLRLVLPVMPDGLEHWRALFIPVIVTGVWHAALAGGVPGIMAGLAWVGLLGASPDGVRGAAILLAGAAVLAIQPSTASPVRSRVRRWWPGLRFVVALTGGWGAVLSVRSGLGVEVVYTVLAAAGLAVMAGRLLRPGIVVGEGVLALGTGARAAGGGASRQHGERPEHDRA